MVASSAHNAQDAASDGAFGSRSPQAVAGCRRADHRDLAGRRLQRRAAPHTLRGKVKGPSGVRGQDRPWVRAEAGSSFPEGPLGMKLGGEKPPFQQACGRAWLRDSEVWSCSWLARLGRAQSALFPGVRQGATGTGFSDFSAREDEPAWRSYTRVSLDPTANPSTCGRGLAAGLRAVDPETTKQ